MRWLVISLLLLTGCSRSTELWGLATKSSSSADAPVEPPKILPGTEPETRITPWATFDRVAYSPDGKRVATAGVGAVVWDRDSNAPGVFLPSDGGTTSFLAWSPDGSRLAVGYPTEVRIFDPSNTDPIAIYRAQTGDTVVGIHYATDGESLGVAAASGKIVEVSPVDATIKRTLRPKDEAIAGATWNATGDTLALLYRKDARVTLVDTKTGTDQATIDGSARDVPLSFAFSPDGKRILEVFSGEHLVHILDVASKTPYATFPIDVSRVTNAAWSPDNGRIAIGGYDGSARIIDASYGTQTTLLSGISRRVSSVGWSPDGKELATAGNYVLTWALNPPAVTRRFVGSAAPISRLVCARDDKSLLAWDDDLGLMRWNVQSGAPTPIHGSESPRDPRGTEHFRDGLLAVVEGPDGVPLLVWQSGLVERVGDSQPTILDDWDGVRTVGASPDGRRVAGISHVLGDKGPKLTVWDLDSGRILSRNLTVAKSFASDVAWSPDGSILAISNPRQVVLVDPTTGKVKKIIGVGPRVDDAFGEHRMPMVFSPDAQALAVGLGKSTEIYRVEDGLRTATITGIRASAVDGRFEPAAWVKDGKSIIDASGLSGDVATGVSTQIVNRVSGSACASHDGSWVAFTNVLGPTLRRSDGLVIALSRVAVGPAWEALAVTNDGRFDAGPSAQARTWIRQLGHMVLLTDQLHREPGLMGAAFRK